MEKISRIVRGNSRVAAVDTKSAAPVRPGTPTYGRPVGESTVSPPMKTSTASRAVALHKELKEAKEAVSQERVISKLADDFFMSRVRRPADTVEAAPGAEISVPEIATGVDEDVQTTDELVLAPGTQPPPEQREYTPRGSYVDVRA